MSPKRCLAAALALIAFGAVPLRAETTAPASPAQASRALAEWNAMLDSLRGLPGRILARLPEEMRDDPHVQLEAAQLALGAITSSGIQILGGDVDHPMFLPGTAMIFGIGQPNADTIYKVAYVAPDGSYRLRGRAGRSRMAMLAQHGPVPGDIASRQGSVGPATSHLDLASLRLDANGDFDLLISPVRPEGYAGDWWKLEPGTAKIMVRQVSADWAHESEATLAIERLDRPVTRPRPSQEELRQRLVRLSQAANFIGPLLAGDFDRYRRAGAINRLVEHNLDRGLLAGQFYYAGAYELADDEALILETPMPENCRYWSIILTNHLYVTTDWYNNQSTLNDAQASADRDGTLRVVISARDPGVPNWMDTAGYRQGLVQGRWVGCDRHPVPSLRKVAMADVLNELPRDTPRLTPAGRERILRERRAAAQQRRLW